VSTFEPRLPGTGALLRRGLSRFLADCTNGLAEHASKLTAAHAEGISVSR
jgi:hypothetical protein